MKPNFLSEEKKKKTLIKYIKDRFDEFVDIENKVHDDWEAGAISTHHQDTLLKTIDRFKTECQKILYRHLYDTSENGVSHEPALLKDLMIHGYLEKQDYKDLISE